MRASVVIVAYNSGRALVRCVESLRAEGGHHEIIVVNNGRRSPEIDAVAELGATVIEPGENLGYAGGSSLGAERASGDVVVFLNPDTTVAAGAVEALAAAVEDEAVAIAMARLRLLDDPETLNSAGCVIHVSGLAWSDGYGDPAASITEPREITYANGSALAMRTELFRSLGGFTRQLFLYHEDLELGWRARMRGYRIVLDPRADVFHEYDYARNTRKNYFMERNRLIFVASSYSLRLIAVLTPVLVAAEVGLLLVAAREGWFKEKVDGWWWCARNGRWILRHRRRLQRSRTVPDRELARHLTTAIAPRMVPVPRLVTKANPLVAGYWAFAQRLL